jgi:cell wall-associated NlpC family hydrolase
VVGSAPLLTTVLAALVASALPAPSVARAIANAAREHLAAPPAKLPRRDCSGLVMSVLQRAGVPAEGDSSSFWYDAVAEGRAFEVGEPAPGDLAFFDRTWDKNHNGRVDDELTHVAVVIAVHEDGRVEMVHRERAGVRRLWLHLSRPDEHRDDEHLLNDYLRATGYGSASAPRLAGQLLRGFARPPGS